MKVIRKHNFEIKIGEAQEINLPTHLMLMNVGIDSDNKPAIWTITETDDDSITSRRLFIVGAEEELPSDEYLPIGMCVLDNDYHVFLND